MQKLSYWVDYAFYARKGVNYALRVNVILVQGSHFFFSAQYWHNATNRRNFLKDFAKAQNFDPLDSSKWYMFTRNDLLRAKVFASFCFRFCFVFVLFFFKKKFERCCESSTLNNTFYLYKKKRKKERKKERSEEKRSELEWSEAKRSEAKRSEVKRSEAKWSEAKQSENKIK